MGPGPVSFPRIFSPASAHLFDSPSPPSALSKLKSFTDPKVTVDLWPLLTSSEKLSRPFATSAISLRSTSSGVISKETLWWIIFWSSFEKLVSGPTSEFCRSRLVELGVVVPDSCCDSHPRGHSFAPVGFRRTTGPLSGNGEEVPELETPEPGDMSWPIGLPGYSWNNCDSWWDDVNFRSTSPFWLPEPRNRANGTSGDEGVVRWTDSGGGVNGAVDGSVVYVENTGGDTNCLSWA